MVLLGMAQALLNLPGDIRGFTAVWDKKKKSIFAIKNKVEIAVII